MNSNSKLIKRAFSFIMALALVLSMVLVPGVFPATVSAVEETEPSAVIYVDGVGSDDADGSKEKPYATLTQAYGDIPEKNVKTYIVICGTVVISEREEATKKGVTWYSSYWWIAPHEGEVVFTSKYGEDNYPKASFGLNRNWILLGNTSLENISITHKDSSAIYANHYNLRLGENVKYPTSGFASYQTVAEKVYIGANSTIYSLHKTEPKDVTLTMESGKITALYGTGQDSQGSYDLNVKKPNVTLNIAGGNVTTLDLANSGYQQIGNVNVNIGGEATVGTIVKTNDKIMGTLTCVLDLKGKAVTMTVGDGIALDIIDTANTAKDGSTAGKATITGTVNTVAQYDGMRYLAVTNVDGSYSAHPFNLTVTKYGINLNKEEPEVAFNAAYVVNDVLKNTYLKDWGISVKDGVGEEVYSAEEFGWNENNFARVLVELTNSLTTGIDVAKSVNAYMDFKIGGETVRVYNADHSALTNLKPRDVLTAIAGAVKAGTLSATDAEKAKLNELMANLAQN